MMTINQLRDFICELAPEVTDTLCVADVADTNQPDIGGFAFADSWLPHNIYSIPHWSEPGPLIVFDLAATESAAKNGREDICLRAVAIHEAAHVLPLTDPAERAERAEVPAETISRLARESLAVPAEQCPYILQTHDVRWVRRCAHLFTRAMLSDHEVYACDVLSYPWLAKLNSYIGGPLLAETFRYRNATFGEIEQLDLHDSILRQFISDRNYYLKSPDYKRSQESQAEQEARKCPNQKTSAA